MLRLSPGTASPFRVTPVVRPFLTEPGPGDMPSTTWALSAFCCLSLPSGGSAFRLTGFFERGINTIPAGWKCQHGKKSIYARFVTEHITKKFQVAEKNQIAIFQRFFSLRRSECIAQNWIKKRSSIWHCVPAKFSTCLHVDSLRTLILIQDEPHRA